jgi:HlyD family secretion protein
MLKYILPLISTIGIISAITFSATYSTPKNAVAADIIEPPSSPFKNTVSGVGIVEANTKNIDIGSSLSGVVEKVFITEGQIAKAGAPLFELDSRQAQANIENAKAAIEVVQAQIADEQDQLTRAERLKEGSSITIDALQRRKFAVERSKASLAQARAQLNIAQTEVDLATVKAPVEGKILKIRIEQGEFVDRGKTQAPVTMGNDNPLHLRVSIDENDLYRFKPENTAKGALRSNKDVTFELKFVRLEPYVQPKRELTGDFAERVDTRVIEVIYSFVPPEDVPVFIGQQMDVFVKE